uniref:Uncharacterized protein n=1 Tax=Ditylenchus dipsaci TaxID=166011 RepID=A0A915ETC0_9BILA
MLLIQLLRLSQSPSISVYFIQSSPNLYVPELKKSSKEAPISFPDMPDGSTATESSEVPACRTSSVWFRSQLQVRAPTSHVEGFLQLVNWCAPQVHESLSSQPTLPMMMRKKKKMLQSSQPKKPITLQSKMVPFQFLFSQWFPALQCSKEMSNRVSTNPDLMARCPLLSRSTRSCQPL